MSRSMAFAKQPRQDIGHSIGSILVSCVIEQKGLLCQQIVIESSLTGGDGSPVLVEEKRVKSDSR
jgi:hypothetical protein